MKKTVGLPKKSKAPTTKGEKAPLWKIVDSITVNKRDLVTTEEVVIKDYNAWTINRYFSFFPDTILYANDMNLNYLLDPKMQYDYYRNVVRKGGRFTSFLKNEITPDFLLVQQYYKYNYERTKEALRILTAEQINEIRKKSDKGGMK